MIAVAKINYCRFIPEVVAWWVER